MKRVTGIGGIFFKADHPDTLYAWYEKHLGLKRSEEAQAVLFEWPDSPDPGRKGMTVWSLFPRDTKYFKDSSSPVMINYIVDNLDELLTQLAKEGVAIDPERGNYDYGRFAWITDPEGNRIELWEPAKQSA